MATPLQWTPNPNCRIGRVTFKRRASSRFLPEFNVTTNRLLAARAALIQGAKGQ